MILYSTAANALADLDKVCLSVAVIPLAASLGWNSVTVGWIHSAFFCGFTIMQIPSGILAEKFGGQNTLVVGVCLWSAGTFLAPVCSSVLPIFLVSRVLVGIGEGFAPTSLTDVIARWVPDRDRTSAAAQIFTGQNYGNVLGLLLTPVILTYCGGPAGVFYIFGAIGLLWCVVWRMQWKGSSAPREPVNPREYVVEGEENSPPWGNFLRSKGVWAVIAAHFADNWAKFALTAWLPTYFTKGFGIPLSASSMLALVPPLLGILVAGAAGRMATQQIQAGQNVTQVRRRFMTLALLLPAGCLACACVLHLPALNSRLASLLAIAATIASIGLARFCVASLYCLHADMSHKHSAPLLGITNTAGALAGVISSPVVGFLYSKTGSWSMSLFLPTIVVYLIGAAVFLSFVDARPHNFDAKPGEPIILPLPPSA
eukprot:CAMPEP_0196589000 /NCGR_PEP_ID=MMETSP1081-20130531/62360_1 /TAXON_ID=36882 /ORGANISM="Pyramimonas amylifera, Strain CCMP720" /LENGTH=427 /DNA_ID=CAMNT_0041911669 /DNA_START=250 /DNA_END=1533 /DNA_ORIENTATION=-